MNYLDHILKLAERWLPLGEKVLENGTRLIGHLPPHAYLHEFFPPLTGGEFEVLEMFIQRPLPGPLRELLARFNGFRLFLGEIGIDGLRKSHGRTLDDVHQPFAMETPNVGERPAGAPREVVFFGGYSDDGTLLAMSPGGPEVFASERRVWRVKAQWPNLETCLVSEAERLAKFYDEAGRFLGEIGKVAPGNA